MFSQMYVTLEGKCNDIWPSTDIRTMRCVRQMYVTMEGECNYILVQH